MEKYSVCSKDEMYSYDELKIIFTLVSESDAALREKIKSMLEVLESKRNEMAIFFMPQNSFDVFSLFQTNYSVCKILHDDVQQILNSLKNCGSSFSENIKNHLTKKLTVLSAFLEKNPEINAVAIQSDTFSSIE